MRYMFVIIRNDFGIFVNKKIDLAENIKHLQALVKIVGQNLHTDTFLFDGLSESTDW